MAERKDLTIRVRADDKGLRVLSATAEDTAKKVQSSFQKSAQNISSTFTRLGKQFTVGFTLPVQAGAALVTKFAIDFESAFAGVRKTVNATEPEFKRLSEGIRAMAREIPVGANELAGLAEIAGQLGIQTDSILSFTRVIADLGATTDISGEQAALSLSRFINVMGSAQSEIDKLGSTIVALGNQFAARESEIVNIATSLASFGQQVGLTEAQVLAFATTIAASGGEAQAASTAFQKIALTMKDAVITANEDLESFAQTAGLTAEEFRQAFQQDAAVALEAFLEGLREVEEQGGSTASILDELGLADQRLIREIGKVVGNLDDLNRALNVGKEAWIDNTALTKEAQERYKTLASELQKTLNNLKDIGITVGNELTPFVRDLNELFNDSFLPAVRGLAEGFGDLDPVMKDFLIITTGLATALGPLVGTIGLFASLLGGAVVLKAGLAVAAIAGIVGGILTLIKNWDQLVKDTEQAWDDITATVDEGTQGLQDAFRDFFDYARPAWDSFSDFVGGILESLFGKSRNLLNSLQRTANEAANLQGISSLSLSSRISAAQSLARGDFVGPLTEGGFQSPLEGVNNLSSAVQRLEQEFLGAAEASEKAAGGQDKANESAKELNKTLKEQIKELQFQVATFGKSEEFAINLQAEMLLLEGATRENVEAWRDLKLELLALNRRDEGLQATKDLNESLRQELKRVNEEILKFGKSAQEQARIDELLTISLEEADETTRDLAASLADANIQLANMEERAERAKKVKKVIEEIRRELEQTKERLREGVQDIQSFILPESEQLKKRLDERLQTLKEANEREIEIVGGFQRTKQKLIEESEKEISEAIRREEIERLKSTGSFTDAVRASLLEFQDTIRDTSDILTEFFADTFNEIRNIFASFIDDILAGKIDDLKDLWKSALSSMRQIFSQFVAAIATNAIRIHLAPSVGGVPGAAGIGGGGLNFGNLFGLFGGGGGSALDPGTQFINGIPTAVPGAGQGGGFFSQIGRFLPFAAPFLGAGLGFLSGGTGGAISGGITGLGAGGGFLLGGPIGGAIGGILGGFLGDVIAGFFEDRPRLDIEVFGLGNVEEIQNGIARTVNDIIRLGVDEAFRRENIFVKGKGGAEDLEEADAIRELIANTLNNTVDQIFGIINQLPADLASTLRETFVNTELTFRQLIDDVSLEFDEGSSDIEDVKKRFEQFIQGDLQARFLDTIDSFFVAAFQGLGVTADRAQAFVDERLGEIRTTESRERRGELGQEFLQDFQTFVNAFNIVSGNFGDSANLALNQVRTLSDELGFNFIPSLDEITAVLDEGLDTLSIDPETVDKLVQLRQSIIDLTLSVSQSVVSISGTINQLNSDIVSLGGTSQSSAGAIRQAIENIKGLLQNESLGVDERQGLLLQLNQLADALFQATTNASQNAAEQQRQNIETRIEGLREERTAIQEVFQARIDALNEELRIAQSFAQLTDNIQNDIRNILLSQNSVLTPIEQVSFLQSEITDLQRSLNLAGTLEERFDIAGQLRQSLLDLFSAGENAFQPGSPEFFALFSEVTGELENLQDVTANSSRSVEEINAEIESLTAQNNQQLRSIDTQIERLQNINITTGTQTNAEVRELKEFVREQLFGVLDTRTELLDSLQLQQENITVLEQIRDILATGDRGTGGPREPLTTPQPFNPTPGRPVPVEITNTDDTQPDNPVFNPFAFTQPAATGFDQIVRRPTLFMAGEAGPEHVQVTPGGEKKQVEINVNINFTGRNGEQMNIKLIEDSVRTGRLGAVIEDRVRKAIN